MIEVFECPAEFASALDLDEVLLYLRTFRAVPVEDSYQRGEVGLGKPAANIRGHLGRARPGGCGTRGTNEFTRMQSHRTWANRARSRPAAYGVIDELFAPLGHATHRARLMFDGRIAAPRLACPPVASYARRPSTVSSSHHVDLYDLSQRYILITDVISNKGWKVPQWLGVHHLLAVSATRMPW
jgi:hypothetical protein